MSAATMSLVEGNPRRRMMVTPEGIAVPITVASRGARIGALILDFVFLYIGMTVITLLLIWMFGGLMDELTEETRETMSGAAEFLMIVYIAMFFLARYGYFLAFELGPRGATPGKRVSPEFA